MQTEIIKISSFILLSTCDTYKCGKRGPRSPGFTKGGENPGTGDHDSFPFTRYFSLHIGNLVTHCHNVVCHERLLLMSVSVFVVFCKVCHLLKL